MSPPYNPMTMKPRLGWLALLPMAALAACFEKASDAEAAPATVSTSATWELTYETTGHPIVATTRDGGVLSRESDVEALVNNYRVSLGLPALQSLPTARDVARAHSEHMIAHSFFDHRSPEADLPGDRAAKAGLGHERYGENIAAGYTTAQSVFNAWMGSAGHKSNIEDPTWTHHGVGYAFAPSDPSFYYDYWTHDFLRQ